MNHLLCIYFSVLLFISGCVSKNHLSEPDQDIPENNSASTGPISSQAFSTTENSSGWIMFIRHGHVEISNAGGQSNVQLTEAATDVLTLAATLPNLCSVGTINGYWLGDDKQNFDSWGVLSSKISTYLNTNCPSTTINEQSSIPLGDLPHSIDAALSLVSTRNIGTIYVLGGGFLKKFSRVVSSPPQDLLAALDCKSDDYYYKYAWIVNDSSGQLKTTVEPLNYPTLVFPIGGDPEGSSAQLFFTDASVGSASSPSSRMITLPDLIVGRKIFGTGVNGNIIYLAQQNVGADINVSIYEAGSLGSVKPLYQYTIPVNLDNPSSPYGLVAFSSFRSDSMQIGTTRPYFLAWGVNQHLQIWKAETGNPTIADDWQLLGHAPRPYMADTSIKLGPNVEGTDPSTCSPHLYAAGRIEDTDGRQAVSYEAVDNGIVGNPIVAAWEKGFGPLALKSYSAGGQEYLYVAFLNSSGGIDVKDVTNSRSWSLSDGSTNLPTNFAFVVEQGVLSLYVSSASTEYGDQITKYTYDNGPAWKKSTVKGYVLEEDNYDISYINVP